MNKVEIIKLVFWLVIGLIVLTYLIKRFRHLMRMPSIGISGASLWSFLKGLFKLLVGLFALFMIASCPMMNAYISWDKYQREINRNGPSSSSVEIKKTVTIYKEKWSPSVLLNGAAFDAYVLHDDIKMEIKAIYNDGSEEIMGVNGDDQNKRFRRANDIKAIQFRLKSTSGYNETDVTVVFNRPILEAQSVL